MATWEEWIQDIGGKVIGSAAEAKYAQPYEIQRLRLEQLGQMGYYTEGQAGTLRAPGTVAGMPAGTLLLIGGAVLLFMFMKD
jgi:hypothetical protein